ncbi:unnamed protein product [Ceratitis capitata]|uniref:(Mediterranean fruit fly) hypothetical protein n=1 Tax=Ceratitis capitata TaxID=7213 RepID=A0A811U6W4_CERCA|nr:unnamed protein product [Ceratitis capitata]
MLQEKHLKGHQRTFNIYEQQIKNKIEKNKKKCKLKIKKKNKNIFKMHKTKLPRIGNADSEKKDSSEVKRNRSEIRKRAVGAAIQNINIKNSSYIHMRAHALARRIVLLKLKAEHTC